MESLLLLNASGYCWLKMKILHTEEDRKLSQHVDEIPKCFLTFSSSQVNLSLMNCDDMELQAMSNYQISLKTITLSLHVINKVYSVPCVGRWVRTASLTAFSRSSKPQ